MLYLRTILKASIKKHNICFNWESFCVGSALDHRDAYSRQLWNELSSHLQIQQQNPEFAELFQQIMSNQFSEKLKRAESVFMQEFSMRVSTYLLDELGQHEVRDFVAALWAAWFLEFFTNNYTSENNKKLVLNYTTHEIINRVVGRFSAFCLYFEDDFELGRTEIKIIQKIVFKLLQRLVAAGIIGKKLTYECDKAIKSIHIYHFGTKAAFKNTLFHYKIHLVGLNIFVNKNRPYSRGLSYLNVNQIILENTASSEGFSLKNLNLLYKLFATQYRFDGAFYREIRPEVLRATPNCFIDGTIEATFDLKNPRASSYWHNLVFLSLGDDIEWLEQGFFWNYTIDFRGRLYTEAVISYQGPKIFRHLYVYKAKQIIKQEESIIEGLDTYVEKIRLGTNLQKDYPNLDFLQRRKEIFWLFIELAKIFKNTLLSPIKYMITTEELIDFAILNYPLDSNNLEFEKKIEYMLIKSIFRRMGTCAELNFIVYKDATASALQLLTLVLGVRDKASIKIFNLDSRNCWYDPYTYIISLFLSKYEIKSEYLIYFSRSYLKKTIMTFSYSATLYTCMEEYQAAIGIDKLPSKDKKLLTDYFVKFYNFLAGLFDGENLFENSITKLTTHLLENLEYDNRLIIQLNDGSSAPMHYFTKKSRRINTPGSDGQRTTVLFWSPTQILDMKKTSNALKPNTIHALDAALVRLTIGSNPNVIATIHDSFGAPLNEIEGIINLVNININLIYYKAYGVDWYSNKKYYSVYAIF